MKRIITLLPVCCLYACAALSGNVKAGGEPSLAGPSPSEPLYPAASESTESPRGWLSWRGPDQAGSSGETGLFDELTLDGKNHLWTYDLSGRGTPVISNGRVFALGYEGEAPDLQELLVCLDESTGKLLWEHRFTDFLSDMIYSRYAIGSPTVDPETGNVFALTVPGLIHALTPDGEMLWQRSMMEDLGRLSFPNGRLGAPLIVGDLVIIHFIFASWGKMGPARDRFYAFDKHTGEVVWGCTPGGPPKDSTFSMPVVEQRDGRTLMYAGLGGGHVVCVDALTGDPVWRHQLAVGGINSSVLLHGDAAIVLHGRENLDNSSIGRMVALKLDQEPDENGVLGLDAELWRNDLVAFTSSPVQVGNRVYATTQTGELACVDADTGAVLWEEKLGPDQLHASPLAADGKLYVPLNNGNFFIIRPDDEGGAVLDQDELDGNCLGAPALANGRMYVHTTKHLYCFGSGEGESPGWPRMAKAKAGKAVRLQLVPADVTLRAGEDVKYRARRLDASGNLVDTVTEPDLVVARPSILTDGRSGVGMAKASHDGLATAGRVRVVPSLPFEQDFESFNLDQGGDAPFAFPTGSWLGGRMKWQVVTKDLGQVLSRRLTNPLFQRTLTLLGHTGDSNYTVQADLNSDGNRRSMSSIGVINQRYLFVLKGNHQELEVSSNMERFKVAVPYRWKIKTWYTLKTRVDVNSDGTGVVRAKVWPRDEPEPEDWTLEVNDPLVHTHGAAGVYAFTPQSRFSAYIDNIRVTPNE